MLWFTSDQHFGHENILDYTNRPFNRIGQSDRAIIANYRKCVTPEDTVFFLGDLTLAGTANKGYVEHIVRQLPGRKILILGNHDKLNPFAYVEIGFESVHTSLVLPEYNVVMVHDPAATLVDGSFTWLHGHVHTIYKQIKDPKRQGSIINVSVEQWEYFPVSLEELRKLDDNIRR